MDSNATNARSTLYRGAEQLLTLANEGEYCDNFFFKQFFFKIETSEWHTATDIVNFVYYPTGFV